MPVSPEIFLLTDQVKKFTRAGLTFELFRDLIIGRNNRDIVSDARRVLPEFLKDISVNISGEENIQNSGLIVFNHPGNDIMVPALLSLFITVNELTHKYVSLVKASDIMLLTNYNDKKPLPGSVAFMKRFNNLYGENIISLPTLTSRKDYVSGRAVAARKIIEYLRRGQLVALAPEGHTEINNEISPLETYHDSSGTLIRYTSRFGLPIVPIGIWKEKNVINLKIGKPAKIFSENNLKAVVELMGLIAENLPEKHRGPFRN